MKDSESGAVYARAVERFGRLVEAAAAPDAEGVHDVSKRAGLPTSSGYRAVKQLESFGFISRDSHGKYRQGHNAVRAGLASLCPGLSYEGIEPVLLRLSNAGRLTVSLAVLSGGLCRLGPTAIGRAPMTGSPQPQYSIVAPVQFDEEQFATLILRAPAEQAPRTIVFARRLGARSDVIPTILAFPPPGAANRNPVLRQLLSAAANGLPEVL